MKNIAMSCALLVAAGAAAGAVLNPRDYGAKGKDSPAAAGFPGRIDGLRFNGCEWNVRTK